MSEPVAAVCEDNSKMLIGGFVGDVVIPWTPKPPSLVALWLRPVQAGMKLYAAPPQDALDAKRYRWLRDKHEWYECYLTGTMQTKFDAKYETLDAAIDAAMNKEPTK